MWTWVLFVSFGEQLHELLIGELPTKLGPKLVCFVRSGELLRYHGIINCISMLGGLLRASRGVVGVLELRRRDLLNHGIFNVCELLLG